MCACVCVYACVCGVHLCMCVLINNRTSQTRVTRLVVLLAAGMTALSMQLATAHCTHTQQSGGMFISIYTAPPIKFPSTPALMNIYNFLYACMYYNLLL